MTLHKLGEPDPEPPPNSPIVIDLSMSDDEWQAKYGHWRYQCDQCGQAYPLKEWNGFGLTIGAFNSLTSWDVNVWDKLAAGDAHFCDPKCAGEYFLHTIGGYSCTIDFAPRQ